MSKRETSWRHICRYANTLRTAAGAVSLVSLGEDRFFLGRLPAVDAFAGAAGLFEGNATHGRFGFFLNAGFAIGVAAPPGKGETFFDRQLEFSVVGRLGGVGFAKREGAIEERLLNFLEELPDGGGNSLLRDKRLAVFSGTVAAGQNHRTFGDIPVLAFQASTAAAHFPVCEFEAGA